MVGHDYRSYSLSIKQALTLGLIAAGCEVLDIGLALSPMAYFAQFDLDAPCVAMVTASHNENGWTGVKMGAQRPLTFGPDEMGRLKEIVLAGELDAAAGRQADPRRGRAPSATSPTPPSRVQLKRPLKVVAACGNGTAGAFAPEALRRMGGRGDRDGLRARLDLPQATTRTPKTTTCCTPWPRRCASTAPTWRSASTATATAAAWSTTRARRSSPTRSA